jgi:hypothetical protein
MFQSPPQQLINRRGTAAEIDPKGSSLALALRAQWAVLVQSAPGGRATSVPRATHEAEIVRLLGCVKQMAASLSSTNGFRSGNTSSFGVPSGGAAGILKALDFDELLPLTLAMGIAPLPSVESQISALHALVAVIHATAASTSSSGPATGVLVKAQVCSLLKAHQALQGIEVALTSAATAEVTQALLELLLCIVSKFSPIAESLLAAPQLLGFLCDGVEVLSHPEVCFIASILQVLCQFTDGPRILVAMNAHHKLLTFLAANTNGDRNVAAQTAVLQVLVSMSLSSPAGFLQITRQAAFARILLRLTSEKWLNPVQLSCLLLSNLSAAGPNGEETLDLATALSRNGVWAAIASLIGKTLPRCSGAAAQAIYTFSIHHAGVIAEAVVSSKGAIHSMLYKLLDNADPVDVVGSRIGKNFTALSLAMFLASSVKARSVLRTVLSSHVSPVSTHALRDICVACLQDTSDSFFEPIRLCTNPNTISNKSSQNYGESKTEEIELDDDGINAAAHHPIVNEKLLAPPSFTGEGTSGANAVRPQSCPSSRSASATSVLAAKATRVKLIRVIRQFVRVHADLDDGTVVIATALPVPINGGTKSADSNSMFVGGTPAPVPFQKSVMFQEALEVIVQLAHHYRHNRPATTKRGPSALTGKKGLRFAEISAVDVARRNPWSPPVKHDVDRTWCIDDLQRTDVFTFEVDLENVPSGLPVVLQRLEQHTQDIGRALLSVSMSFPQRRCVLQDLHQNVFPKISMFISFILQQLSSSRAVVKAIAECSRKVDSGNILQLYRAAGLLTSAS